MNVNDKTGRKLKIGQILDVVMLGTFQGKLVRINSESIVLAPGQQSPPHVVIQIITTPLVHPSGLVPDVYIIGDPDPNDPLVKNDKESGRIVRLQ